MEKMWLLGAKTTWWHRNNQSNGKRMEEKEELFTMIKQKVFLMLTFILSPYSNKLEWSNTLKRMKSIHKSRHFSRNTLINTTTLHKFLLDLFWDVTMAVESFSVEWIGYASCLKNDWHSPFTNLNLQMSGGKHTVCYLNNLSVDMMELEHAQFSFTVSWKML